LFIRERLLQSRDAASERRGRIALDRADDVTDAGRLHAKGSADLAATQVGQLPSQVNSRPLLRAAALSSKRRLRLAPIPAHRALTLLDPNPAQTPVAQGHLVRNVPSVEMRRTWSRKASFPT